MHLQPILKSQYHAALAMLREAIIACPKNQWNAPPQPFWRVACHTLFYTHFYLGTDDQSFVPWKHHIKNMHTITKSLPSNTKPLTRAQLLSYCKHCDKLVDKAVDTMDLSSPRCGFPWYPMGKLEHQLVNIRHIQHHAAILSARVRALTGKGVDWVGKGSK